MSPSTGTLVPARVRADLAMLSPTGLPPAYQASGRFSAVGRVNVAPARSITVYLLDDHEIVRRGVRELLESTDDLLVVGETGWAQEAARHSHKESGLMFLLVGQTG